MGQGYFGLGGEAVWGICSRAFSRGMGAMRDDWEQR